MLMKPGPATSTEEMPSAAESTSANLCARSRGAMPAFLPSCMAIFVDQSPCARSLGRITTISPSSGSMVSVRSPAFPSATRVCAACAIICASFSGFMGSPSVSCIQEFHCFRGLEGIRTLDLLFRRQTLYPLSYKPERFYFSVSGGQNRRSGRAGFHIQAPRPLFRPY